MTERPHTGPYVNSFRLRRPQLILSLCDRTGNWSRPYEDDDYDVIRIDLASPREH